MLFLLLYNSASPIGVWPKHQSPDLVLRVFLGIASNASVFPKNRNRNKQNIFDSRKRSIMVVLSCYDGSNNYSR